MDERKKTIRDLEDRRRQDLAAAEEAFGALGKSMLEGLEKNGETFADGNAESAGAALEEYRRLLSEIAENQERVADAEADIDRYQKVTEEISRKEKQKSKDTKELSSFFARIGRQVLSDPAFENFASGYKAGMEGLLAGIEDREARLDELEQKNGNILAWVGKNAETLMVKTVLLKNQADLHKIYRTAGEKFIADGEDFEAGEDELHDAAGGAADLRQALEDLAYDIAALKEEKKNTAARFRGEGNPVRCIQNFEKNIAAAKEGLTKLYRSFGKLSVEKKQKSVFSPFFGEKEKELAERASSLTLASDESLKQIEKLKAAIDIDGEKAGIEKIKGQIENENKKIETARGAIAGFETDIEAAEERIAELTKLL